VPREVDAIGRHDAPVVLLLDIDVPLLDTVACRCWDIGHSLPAHHHSLSFLDEKEDQIRDYNLDYNLTLSWKDDVDYSNDQ